MKETISNEKIRKARIIVMSRFMKETPKKFFQTQSNRRNFLQLWNKLSLNERTIYHMQYHKKCYTYLCINLQKAQLSSENNVPLRYLFSQRNSFTDHAITRRARDSWKSQ